MEIYTMGFTQKSAEKFFELIKKHKIELLIDIRLNNQSQLAGFTKGRDLQYFLDKICGCAYVHDDIFAPTKEVLSDYKKKAITWDEYVVHYDALLNSRAIVKYFMRYTDGYNKVLLLCSEPTPENCHRRLLAEFLQEKLDEVKIMHI